MPYPHQVHSLVHEDFPELVQRDTLEDVLVNVRQGVGTGPYLCPMDILPIWAIRDGRVPTVYPSG